MRHEVEGVRNSTGGTIKVRYQRGPDMGGGVGGLLYTLRGSDLKYAFNNGRGDIVAQHDSAGALTWSASYEAFGKRPVENGNNADRQRANSKDEDPTGLLNEGFFYRDLETGVWLSRDPAGFVDGPNLYCYVRQNPWTMFDPEGLASGWIDMRAMPNCDPSIRAALDERDREIARSTSHPSTLVGATLMSGFVPGVGELQDFYTLVAKDSTKLDRGIAAASLLANGLTAGFAPNFGAPAKLARKAEQNADSVLDAAHTTNNSKAITKTVVSAKESAEEGAQTAAKTTGAAERGGLNLFRAGPDGLATREAATGWRQGDRMLYLPNQGSAQANWAQNAGRLRQEMRAGEPIFDSYRDAATGLQIPAGTTPTSGGRFLNAERKLLESRGWQYNPSTGAYHPPTP